MEADAGQIRDVIGQFPIKRDGLFFLETDLGKTFQRDAEEITDDLEFPGAAKDGAFFFRVFFAKEAAIDERKRCDRCFLMAYDALIDVEPDAEIHQEMGEIDEAGRQRIEAGLDALEGLQKPRIHRLPFPLLDQFDA